MFRRKNKEIFCKTGMVIYLLTILAIFFCGRGSDVYAQIIEDISLNTNSSTPAYLVAEADPETGRIQFLTTIHDLLVVGFTKVEELKPVGNRFQAPVQYFRVEEHAIPADHFLDCSDCNNLVSIYITPQMVTSSPMWAVRQNPFIDTVGGLARVRLFAADRIIYVIAPNEDYAYKLAEHLRERVVLNQTLLKEPSRKGN